MATIRQRKSGYWQAIIRRKGHATISKTFPIKRQAERWATQQESALFERAYLTPQTQTTTVRALLQKYQETITPRKQSKVKEESRISILTGIIGDYILAELTPEVIIDYVDTRLEDVVPDTVRKELSTLKVALDAGMALWGYRLPANPVVTAMGVLKVTKTLTPGQHRTRRPTPAELAALIERAPGNVGLLIEYACETAMRRGEIAAQRASHRRGNILHIPDTKTGRPRTIPLSRRAVEILDSLPVNKDDAPVWGVKPMYITLAFRRTCAKVEIRDLRFHDLRHEGTSRFFERGLGVAEVTLITGQTIQTVQRYTHISPESVLSKLGHETSLS